MRLPMIAYGLSIALILLSGCGWGRFVGAAGGTGASGASRASSSSSSSSSSSGAAVTGSATLTWDAPTQNSDGSPLTNPAGYRIYYGTNATALTQTIDVPARAGVSRMSYVVQGLSAGTWYFAVSAYTSTGAESSRSSVGSKTIN